MAPPISVTLWAYTGYLFSKGGRLLFKYSEREVFTVVTGLVNVPVSVAVAIIFARKPSFRYAVKDDGDVIQFVDFIVFVNSFYTYFRCVTMPHHIQRRIAKRRQPVG